MRPRGRHLQESQVEQDIRPEARSLLGMSKDLANPVIDIAKEFGTAPAQVNIRWHLQFATSG